MFIMLNHFFIPLVTSFDFLLICKSFLFIGIRAFGGIYSEGVGHVFIRVIRGS